jgi:hypothetical protein
VYESEVVFRLTSLAGLKSGEVLAWTSVGPPHFDMCGEGWEHPIEDCDISKFDKIGIEL